MSVTIDQSLQVAIGHQQAGRFDEASQIYQQILAEQPQHPDALHLLGLLARRAGDGPRALSLLKQAVAVNPSPQFRSNLGIALLEAGQTAAAVSEFKDAVRLAPNYAKAHSNLGSALMKQGHADQAAEAFAIAIQRRRDLVEAWLGLADALRDLGRLSESVATYQQALSIRPDLPQAHIGLGHALCRLGEIDAGIESYRQALQISPQNANAFNGLGNALATIGRFDEAESAFRSALATDPNVGAVWNNIGNLFHAQVRADEALDAYQRAIAANPQLGGGYNNLGNALRDRGRVPEAIAAFRRAVELDPTSSAVHSNLAYAVCFDPDYNARQILDEARFWADRHETPLLPTHRAHTNHRDPNRILRVGYVSADFRDHVIGRNVLPIFECHNRDQFEIHLFSTLIRHDAATDQFVRAADRWHECASLGNAQLAEKVRAEKIDILVDLTLHIAGNRLPAFARKPAPLQVTWAGYPGTTGLRSIDYRITDPYIDPTEETDSFYSEKSLRLPHSFWCYRPAKGTPDVNSLPALTNGFITFGCLNNSAKVTQPTLDLWSRVLQAMPQSQLLMYASEGSLRTEIGDHFQANGIDINRIKFVGPAISSQHLIRYHLIDICLDPQPYTGHTTTIEGLWMGVPVVTLSGKTSVARGSVTALTNVGLNELITVSSEQYIAAAVKLAESIPQLAELRSSLRDRMRSSPLCDERRFTTDLESAYRKIWQTWVRENPVP